MSKFILAVLLLVSVPSFAFADEWSTGDTWREVSFQGLWLIDALQTHKITESASACNLGESNQVQGCSYLHEQNNYLGLHPTIGAINRYFLVGSALHAGIAYILPEKYRAPFQLVTIGVEVGDVGNNISLGIGF